MSDPVALLQQLVRLPSVNPACGGASAAASGSSAAPPPTPTGEGALVDFLERWLAEAGLPARRQPVEPGRDNLLAVLPGRGSRALLLEAHLDTVSGAGMTHAPFGGELREGRVWGRGACDAKGSLAAMLSALRRAAAERLPAGGVLAMVVDEEYRFRGIEQFCAQPSPLPLHGAVVGEPTRLQVVNRHGGAVRLRFTLAGRAAHTAYPEQGDNALYPAARLLEALRLYHEQLRRAPHEDPDTPRSCCPTLICGGEAINVVPQRCEVSLDRRLASGESPEAVCVELEALARETVGGACRDCAVILLDEPLCPAAPAPLAELCLQAVREVCGAGALRGVAYSTDATKIARPGLEAVVLGPGDIAQAHAAEEWVEAEQVEQAAEIYYRVLAGAGEL